MNNLWAQFPTVLASFLLTYTIHSSVAVGLWWIVYRGRLRFNPSFVEWFAKAVVLVPLCSALAGTAAVGWRAQPSHTPRQPQVASSAPVRQEDSQVSAALNSRSHSDTRKATEHEWYFLKSQGGEEQLTRELPRRQSAFLGWAVQLARWLSLGWCGWGVLFTLVMVLRIWRMSTALQVISSPLSSAHCALDQLLTAQKINRPVWLWASEKVSQPVAFGHFRWHIVLPSQGYGPAGPELQAVLAHELAHLVRRDWSWLLLARWICGVFFVQPLNKCVVHQWRSTSEHLADSWALNTGVDPSALVACLLRYADAGQVAGNVALGFATFCASDLLMERINRIYGSRSGKSVGTTGPRARAVRTVAAVAGAAAALAPLGMAGVGSLAIRLPEVAASELREVVAETVSPGDAIENHSAAILAEIEGLKRDLSDARQLAEESSVAPSAISAVQSFERRVEKLLQTVSGL